MPDLLKTKGLLADNFVCDRDDRAKPVSEGDEVARACTASERHHMKNNREVAQSFAMVMQFGINMLVPILACTLFGAWLGEKLQISWLAIPFFIIGALAGMRNVFVFARRIYQPKEHSDRTNKIEGTERSDVKKTQ